MVRNSRRHDQNPRVETCQAWLTHPILATLNPQDRELLELRAEGTPYRQIEQRLGCTNASGRLSELLAALPFENTRRTSARQALIWLSAPRFAEWFPPDSLVYQVIMDLRMGHPQKAIAEERGLQVAEVSGWIAEASEWAYMPGRWIPEDRMAFQMWTQHPAFIHLPAAVQVLVDRLAAGIEVETWRFLYRTFRSVYMFPRGATPQELVYRVPFLLNDPALGERPVSTREYRAEEELTSVLWLGERAFDREERFAFASQEEATALHLARQYRANLPVELRPSFDVLEDRRIRLQSSTTDFTAIDARWTQMVSEVTTLRNDWVKSVATGVFDPNARAAYEAALSQWITHVTWPSSRTPENYPLDRLSEILAGYRALDEGMAAIEARHCAKNAG